ncbi:T9SS type A sorting domain-containing protein [bacterium]|nr:T9SS type A sorting domain-containing protein [bacterium]
MFTSTTQTANTQYCPEPIRGLMLLLMAVVFTGMHAQAQIVWTQCAMPHAATPPILLSAEDSLRCFAFFEQSGFRTADGGETWSKTLDISGHMKCFDMSADGNAVLFGSDAVYSSSDFGVTWTTEPRLPDSLLPSPYESLSQVEILSPSVQMLCFDSTFYRMVDGSILPDPVLTVERDVETFTFSDSLVGWVAAGDKVMHTTDGGVTWSQQYVEDCTGLLAASRAGVAIVERGLTPNPDPVLTFDFGATWEDIQWPQEAEQIVWPRVPEYDPFSHRDVGMIPGWQEDRIWLQYRLGSYNTGLLYELKEGSARYLGIVPQADTLVSVMDGSFWATAQGISRGKDLRVQLPIVVAENVSSRDALCGLVTLKEGAGPAWTEAEIERSSSDSTWKRMGTLTAPLRVLRDTTVEEGQSYRYRARITTESDVALVYSDIVHVGGETVVDLLEYLLPAPGTKLTYTQEQLRWPGPVVVGSLTETYTYVGTSDTLGFGRVHVFRGESFTHPDTVLYESTVGILELLSDPPSVQFLREPDYGYGLVWPTFARYPDSTGEAYYSTIYELDDFGVWHFERYIPLSSYAPEDDEIDFSVQEYFPAYNDRTINVQARHGLGITMMSAYTHIMPSQVEYRISLDNITGAGDIPTPGTLQLHTNWPNPFTSTTSIAWSLDRAGTVRIALHDALGREVRVLTDGFNDAGRHMYQLSATGLSPGLYFIRATTHGRTQVRKMVIQ